jgi:RNA-directed DNA polymerase
MKDRTPRPTSLQGIAQQAERPQGDRCRNRYGMLNEDFLKQCGRDIRQDAAAGVEQVRAQAYAQHLDANSHGLVARLQQQRYRAQLGRRHDSPTGDGPQRPLGIPAGDDQLRQLAVARLLEAIDAPDCRRGSDGDRPQVGALEAVETLTSTRQFGRDAGVVEADIKKYCDPSDHEWMVRMLAERLADGARLGLIRKWRRAGGLDTDGQVLHPVTGTPPGGTVSPVLAQVFRHDVRDVWCEKVVKRHGRGDACLMRYADDFVCAFENQAAAERCSNVLGRRLATFGRERSAAKTRLLPFSRHHLAGNTRFEFRGFALRWGQDRTGSDHLKRRTARKTRRTALKRFTAWGQANRHLRVPVLCQRLNANLRGYDNDYGVHGNAASLQACFNTAIRILVKWLNRRSPRHSYTWQGYTAVLERFKVARPRIVGRPTTRQAALKAYADLRKRVFLKSPVREHRTPGSGRVPLGNQRSYRDGAKPIA